MRASASDWVISKSAIRRLPDEFLRIFDAQFAGDQLRQERVAENGEGVGFIGVQEHPKKNGTTMLSNAATIVLGGITTLEPLNVLVVMVSKTDPCAACTKASIS